MRSISPGLILTCTIPLLFGSPFSVHAENADHDALSRVLKPSDTVATMTENSFIMDTEHIQWLTPDLGFFTARFSSSPFDGIYTERLIGGMATTHSALTLGPSDIIGIAVSWDRIRDQRGLPNNQRYNHRFITEAFYGIHLNENSTIQPSLGLLTNSANSDSQLIAHLGLSLRF